MSEDLSLPTITPVDRLFWEAATEERLVVQECTECEERIYPPRMYCSICFSDIEWIDTEGIGTIYTYSIVHSPTHPSFRDEVPMVLAVVELVEGPRFVTNVVDCAPKDISIGDKVRVVFDHLTDDVTLQNSNSRSITNGHRGGHEKVSIDLH